MAVTLKEKPDSKTKRKDVEEPALDLEETEIAKSDGTVEYELESPFDGITSLVFRRMTLADLKNIWSHDKSTAQLARFIQDVAEPKLSQEQIQKNLTEYDAEGCQLIMNHLCGGYLDEEEAEASIFDEKPERGNYDKETKRLQLGFPIHTTDANSGEVNAINFIDFQDDVPFGQTGVIHTAPTWPREVQIAIRVYAKPVMLDDTIPLRMMDSLSDQMDATDALQILAEVIPDVRGKSDKKRRFKKR